MKTAQKKKPQREREVVLGGKTFTIYPLAMGAAREWRKKYSQPLQAVISVLRRAGKIELQGDDGTWNVGEIGVILNQVAGLLLGSVDLLVDALFAYSPELEAEREWIEANADDVEAMTALWEVIQLAYPFGSMLTQLNMSGASPNGTSAN